MTTPAREILFAKISTPNICFPADVHIGKPWVIVLLIDGEIGHKKGAPLI